MVKISKFIRIDIQSPFKTTKKLKGIFKLPKCKFRYYFKENEYYPVLWCCKPPYIFIRSADLMWKDKYDSPRFEVPPYIWIHLWKINLVWYWEPDVDYKYIDDYWEQALWYLYYNKSYKMKVPDIIEAKNYWPWQDYETKESTWKNEFLL